MNVRISLKLKSPLTNDSISTCNATVAPVQMKNIDASLYLRKTWDDTTKVSARATKNKHARAPSKWPPSTTYLF